MLLPALALMVGTLIGFILVLTTGLFHDITAGPGPMGGRGPSTGASSTLAVCSSKMYSWVGPQERGTELAANRHSRDELRELLLETGRSMLREEGLGTGAEDLTFKRVFDRLELERGIRLTNASVIRRVWENQAEYQVEVLASIALEESDGEIDMGVESVRPMIEALDRSTPESRAAGMREICRVGGALYAQTVRKSTKWPSWIGVWALVASGESDDHRKRIGEALLAGYESFSDHTEKQWGALGRWLGFRLREPLTLNQFVVATNSLGHGYGLRARIDESMTGSLVRPTGPGGSDQEWSPFAVAFEGLVNQYWVLDADWEPRTTR